MSLGLPTDISHQIELDVIEVGSVLTKLLPSTEEIIVKLQVFGENGLC